MTTLREHERIDQRSLAMHRAIAQKVRADPSLIKIAHENLERWSRTMDLRSKHYLDVWRDLLSLPLETFLTTIVEENEDMTAMRQASPFAGVLLPKERWALHEQFEQPRVSRSGPVNLQHVIRVAAATADTQDIVVIAPLTPDARRVGVYGPKRVVDLIDGTIGEGSPFEREFGYFAHGVDETTAILPEGWRDRLILVSGENTRYVRGWCLEVHDLAIAKYAAGREKDFDFTRTLVREGMVRREVLEERLRATAVLDPLRDLIAARIRRDFASSR